MDQNEIAVQTAQAYMSGRVTQRQLEALELIISHSTKMTRRAKQAILYLLRESEYLSKNVVLTIPYEDKGDDNFAWGLEMVNGHHDSSNMLYDMFNLMGFGRTMHHHCGAATQSEDRSILFETGWDSAEQKNVPVTKKGWTLWLSVEPYQKTDIEVLPFDQEKILSMRLRKSYFHLSQDASTEHSCIHIDQYHGDNAQPKRYTGTLS